MCTLCDQGLPQNHARSQLGRRDFLKASTAAAAAGAGLSLFNAPARARDDDDQGGPPQDSGQRGRRYVSRGGMVMTMAPTMPNKGEFVSADVLVEGKKIVAVGPNLKAGGAGEIDDRRAQENGVGVLEHT